MFDESLTTPPLATLDAFPTFVIVPSTTMSDSVSPASSVPVYVYPLAVNGIPSYTFVALSAFTVITIGSTTDIVTVAKFDK